MNPTRLQFKQAILPCVAFLAMTCRSDSTGLFLRAGTGPEAAITGMPDNGEITAAGGRWSCRTMSRPVPGRQDCGDLEISVKLLEGNVKAAAISHVLELTDWDPAGFVLVPGAVYNGNRFAVAQQGYPPLWRDPAGFRVDMPTTITDQPGLHPDGSPGVIELDTGGATTPALGCRTADGRGVLVLTRPQCEFGNLGITVEELTAPGRLRLVVTAPRSRSRIPNMMGFRAGDPPRDWTAGDEVTLRLRVWTFPAPSVQSLYDRLAECRKDLTVSAPANEIPFSEAWRLLEDKFNGQNWSESLGFYTHGDPLDQARQTHLFSYWQLGWVSGGINTTANLLQGVELSRSRAMRTLDFMFVKTPAPSGFWHGSSNGREFFGDCFTGPHPHQMSMVRKQADGLALGMKQLLLLREQEIPVPGSWENSARALADAFVRHWDRHGQLGQYLDVTTGNILVGGSTAGAHAPAGLVRAARYFNRPAYLEKAAEIARHFVARDLCGGYTCGGPGDALSAPDSESAFALLESLVELHQATGLEEWAGAARDTARLCASWVVSHDAPFPPASHLGRIGARSTGAVWANVQNKHAAPGICALSGDCLFKLWRATGDEFALELVRDIAHGGPQYLSRPGRKVGELPAGWMCERVNLGDWEGTDSVGGSVNFAAPWCEAALMLTTAEIPGVYVQADTRRVVVFDHVDAWLDRDELALSNPTLFDAKVKVLVETDRQAKAPLGVWTLRRAVVVPVPAGGVARRTLARLSSSRDGGKAAAQP